MLTRHLLPAVVLIRHAQSEWNRENRFTGWANPPLTELGRAEAVRAGDDLAKAGFRFDHAYTSRLIRAQDTAEIVLTQSGNQVTPVRRDWRLNERHYGALQGEDKAAMMARVGEQQVWRWRRGFLDMPPSMVKDDPRRIAQQQQWADLGGQLPNSENLLQTQQRVLAFWEEIVAPQLRYGRQLLISSHGNTLRALIMALDNMSVEQVEAFEIPTGVPIVYRFTAQGRPIGWQYLGQAEGQDVA